MKKYFPTINQAFVLVVQWFLLSLLAMLLALPLMVLAYFLEGAPVWEENVKSFAMLLTYVLALYWIIKMSKNKIKEKDGQILKWHFVKVPAKLLVIAAIITVALTVLTDPLTELIPMPESVEKIFKEMVQANVFSFLTLVVAAPVLEELFFRGIILDGFLKNYAPRKAIIWSAVIFGAAHMNPWQFVGAGLAGLLIGWVYYKTGSLIPGMLMHFVNNLISYVVTLSTNKDNFHELFTNQWIYFGIIGISLLIFVLGVFAIHREYMYPVQKSPLQDKINLN